MYAVVAAGLCFAVSLVAAVVMGALRLLVILQASRALLVLAAALIYVVPDERVAAAYGALCGGALVLGCCGTGARDMLRCVVNVGLLATITPVLASDQSCSTTHAAAAASLGGVAVLLVIDLWPTREEC